MRALWRNLQKDNLTVQEMKRRKRKLSRIEKHVTHLVKRAIILMQMIVQMLNDVTHLVKREIILMQMIVRMLKVRDFSNIYFFFCKNFKPNSFNLCSDSKADAAALDECSYPGCGFNLKLYKCATKDCHKVSHHLCQNEYAERMFLQEKVRNFCCINHINDYYNLKGGKGSLESMDARL